MKIDLMIDDIDLHCDIEDTIKKYINICVKWGNYIESGDSKNANKYSPVIQGIHNTVIKENNGITVTIPFNRRSIMGDKVGDKSILSSSQIRVLAEIKNNPLITKPKLCVVLSLSKTTVDNAISFLHKNKYIDRIGSNKKGHWEVLK